MKTKLILFSLLWATLAGAATSFLDTTFNPGTGANGLVESVLVLPGGKILVCGNFTTFNGTNASYMARLNSNGSLDTSFQALPSYWVRTMALQSDGKIVIGGFFTSVEGQSRRLVARLNSDGSLDTTFNPGAGATGVLGVAVDGDADPFVFATAVQSDGKILITGNFTNYNGTDMYGIARLNSDGSLDTTFKVGAGFNVNSWGRSLLVQGNGQIMVTGWFTSYNNQSYNRMVRLNADGSADATFKPIFGDLTAIYGVQQVLGGEYLVVGDSQNTNLFRQNMAKLKADGSFDASFIGADNDKTETLRLQSDGKIVIGGYFSMVEGNRQLNLARLNADGSFDSSFTPAVDNFVWSEAIQSDGKILICGGFQNVEGSSRNGVARLLPTAQSTGGSGGGSGSLPFQASAGNYTGMFYNADDFNKNDVGFLTVTLGPRGGYSSALVLGATPYAFSGAFNSNTATAKATISRGKSAPIAVTYTVSGNSSLTGSVVIGALTSTVTAYRNTFTAANPSTAYAGRYTGLLGGGANGAPAGDGDMALVIDNQGNYSMSGMLADGNSYIRSGWISDTGLVLYYKWYANGVALGWFNAGTSLNGALYWQKSFNAVLPVAGQHYTPPTGAHGALTLSGGTITASGGNLKAALSANFTYTAPNKFTFAAPNTNRFSMTMNNANGAFTGQFLDSATHKAVAFHGVVNQGANSGAGFFDSGGLVTFGPND